MDSVNVTRNGYKADFTFYEPEPPRIDWQKILVLFVIVAGCFLFWVGIIGLARAEEIDVEKLATAIYHAEGGIKTRHPYGILTKYKHTSPRQACINTINHALRDWDGNGDFISFLGSRYCPVGASNDPHGLNRNWIKNVSYFYKKARG